MGFWRSSHYEGRLWPQLNPIARANLYSRAEDDLLWMGIVR
jgi:hypothetical protein